MERDAQYQPVQRGRSAGHHLSEMDSRWRTMRRGQAGLIPPPPADRSPPGGMGLSNLPAMGGSNHAGLQQKRGDKTKERDPHERAIFLSYDESEMRVKTMKPRLPATDGRHIASTPEGCDISRDEDLGFVVACGDEGKGQRRVPTLSAAYAICQQMMPRRPN